ncbi:BTB/POZ and TAZ domain-containing protein 4-like [Diospyros lotus]|uniref:BTB/POZ and TAZ domain-containing protein 4-like n=1 Tax=Diospyros lotus TaxID=55363 RepID=UPI0022574BE9|nr:BTB/POZ and TAZ domain-containing protein 4-like [Diospyros lotus]XP_052197750.1 BTB/POZ and TAZ domain-containing protein 4-like [Diospyros lotus]XP_052197751.1 BTB/POZ and TAZ domain-containing protein 4-like [Diospyros lotus]XP_052197752.1 BTB/POZ and TAZ domain-containing protein 4-like [Diospyros lotus]XP_052197753.1 BTB/POZ and TAZ domain-containing protein 4-like [Diospyros lotus]
MAGEDYASIGRKVPPPEPPLPGPAMRNYPQRGLLMNEMPIRGYNCVSTSTRDLWECLFDEGYRADVVINTEDGGIVYGHASILGVASPVLKSMLKQTKRHGHRRSISIRGVPHAAVQIFIRFLYSSCYDPEAMKKYVIHLLVLSHVYVIPHLKRFCEWKLEQGMLTIDNVVDTFQLALLCDAPRLSIICHRFILKNFKAVSATEGWEIMKQSHPVLEKAVLMSVVEEESRQKEKIRKLNERKVYLQLYEAMEALVHIYRDGCRTIGPHDKVLKEDQGPCHYASCKALELLVRHFAGCKMRTPGGCIRCKRMWQLLELHSHLCADSDRCRVPLCRNFKQRRSTKQKKEDIKWRILVRKILTTKTISGAPCFSMESS